MKVIKIINFFDDKIAKLNTNNKNSDTANKSYYRKLAYTRVSNIIKETYDNNETLTVSKVNKLPITDSMKKKIIYYIKNPKKLKSRAPLKNKNHLMKELTNFMGIGKIKAKEIVDKGLTNIKQLNQKKYKNLLTDQTRVFLSLKPKKKIPHKDIVMLEPLLVNIISETEIIIVGSYRRKTKFSKDIDVMVVSDDIDILNKIIKSLTKKLSGNLSEYKNPNIIPYLIGKDKVSILINFTALTAPDPSVQNTKSSCQPRVGCIRSRSDGSSSFKSGNAKNIYYKVDMFRTSVASKWAMLLYSTGPKYNNIRMRSIAKKKGYLLNQQGLYNRKTKKLLSNNVKSEKYFFDKLDMKYKPPEKRN